MPLRIVPLHVVPLCVLPLRVVPLRSVPLHVCDTVCFATATIPYFISLIIMLIDVLKY